MNHEPGSAPPDTAGFTLIEMMMVVVIIGAMLAFGLPYFRSAKIELAGVDAVLELRLLRLGQRQASVLAALIVEPIKAELVVACHPPLADAAREPPRS